MRFEPGMLDVEHSNPCLNVQVTRFYHLLKHAQSTRPSHCPNPGEFASFETTMFSLSMSPLNSLVLAHLNLFTSTLQFTNIRACKPPPHRCALHFPCLPTFFLHSGEPARHSVRVNRNKILLSLDRPPASFERIACCARVPRGMFVTALTPVRRWRAQRKKIKTCSLEFSLLEYLVGSSRFLCTFRSKP